MASAARTDGTQGNGRPRPLRPGVIRRERLVSSLRSAPDASVATVVAPAGYGKTTVLSEWDEHDDRPFAWLTLDDRDNDPGLLTASVANALTGRHNGGRRRLRGPVGASAQRSGRRFKADAPRTN